MDDLLDGLSDIEKDILKKFQNDEEITYDKSNDKHRILLNEYVKDNIDFWVDEYSSCLSKYDMKVKFINAEEYNTN